MSSMIPLFLTKSNMLCIFCTIRFSTNVNPGDVVQVNLSKGSNVVGNDDPDSSIIVHPNTLVSATSVANSITCTRK